MNHGDFFYSNLLTLSALRGVFNAFFLPRLIHWTVILKKGGGDDTAANGIRLKTNWGWTYTPGDGFWGSWSNWAYCPPQSRIIGFQTQVEPAINGDDTALNGVKILCGSIGTRNSYFNKQIFLHTWPVGLKIGNFTSTNFCMWGNIRPLIHKKVCNMGLAWCMKILKVSP